MKKNGIDFERTREEKRAFADGFTGTSRGEMSPDEYSAYMRGKASASENGGGWILYEPEATEGVYKPLQTQ